MLRSLRQRAHRTRGNPLVPVVAPFDQRTRHALYAASTAGVLKRHGWNGCALNRAAAGLGACVTSREEAAEVFDVEPHLIAEFISVWDTLRGSDERCTGLLRDAILAVGLFPGTEAATAAPDASDALSRT